ncbi:MAG: hypothetical protein ACXWXO_19945 [Nocardioides sp.]
MSKRNSALVAVIVGVVGGVLAGAIVGGSALVGASAQPGSGPASSNADNAAAGARPCGALLDRLPDDLKADLQAARALPPGDERLAALKEIAKAARDGDYGAGVEKLAERRFDHRKELWSRLPAELRADLGVLRDTPADERKAALEEIRKSALAGDYETLVEQFAKHRQERRDECRA